MDISHRVDAMLAERRRKADLLDQQKARLKDLQADLRNRQVMLHAIHRYDMVIEHFRRDHINIVMWNDPKPYTGIYAASEAADLRERFPELSDACCFFGLL